MLNIAYGRTEKVSYADPDIQLVNQCGDRLGQTLRPGSFKVESLPWLQYVPGYTKMIDGWHADELMLFRGQLDTARERLVRGFYYTAALDSHGVPHQMQKESSVSCFTRFISEKQQGGHLRHPSYLWDSRDSATEYRLSDDECAYLCGSLCERFSRGIVVVY